ncbi:hypothetical protein PF003_g15587 [Phytophthora fragariae]|nr:hypothetical protein PF003_g15587 [Phytophthora fragariae]
MPLDRGRHRRRRRRRVSARLRGKQAARVIRAAARKVKRVGAASGASPKRRKSSTAAAPSSEAGAPASATCTPRPSARADFPSALVAGVDSAGIAPTSPPSPTPSAPVYSGGPPDLTAVPPPALDRSDPPSSPSLMVTGEVAAPAPDTAPGHDVDAPLSAVASARVPATVEPLRPIDYPEFAVMGSDLMPGSSQAASAAFNLAAFAPAYTPEPVTADPPTVTQRLSLAAKVDQLFEMFTELRRELQSRAEDVPPHVGPSTDRGFLSQSSTRPSGVPAGASPAPPGSWTLPPSGNSADMPPAAVSELRCDSFQLPRTRVKGEYYPPLAHQLAAHRLFRDLSSETGRWLSPMSFVLHLRELECVRFDAPPAVLMALYSGRLGSRGLTVMHFRPQSEMEQLERGSSNANFSADFGAGATLPATTVDCPTYEDLLAAIGGLISFGDALWYDHARRLLSRVNRFVLANLERDHNTHERVMLTVMFVNQFIGRALAHLLVDSPHWWRNFNEAVRAVDYHSPDWQAALNGLALRMASTPARASNGSQPVQTPRPGGAPSRRGPAGRTPIMPERIRRLIPRDRDGCEPCLRFMGGGMCYGGSAERCAHQQRTHRWDGRLPRELQEFIDRTYRSGPRQSVRREHS